MKRAATGLACVALAGGVWAGAAVESALAAPPAPREGCVWQRHSRRAVRHVRRHGLSRRVTRLRHWWTCDPTPGPPATTPIEIPLPGPPLEETPPSVSHLGVKAEEWNFTLSRPEVSSGEVVVELNNEGEDNHNLKIQREGGEEAPLAVPEAASDEQTTARFNLPPGTYHLYCSLFQHEEKGMHATLVVGGG